MKQFKFDSDEQVDEEVQPEDVKQEIKGEVHEAVKVEGVENEDDYELFEYNEEYEVEEDEEVEVTDDVGAVDRLILQAYQPFDTDGANPGQLEFLNIIVVELGNAQGTFVNHAALTLKGRCTG